MSAIKLQKIGNSLGFRVPKSELDKAEFDVNSEYELISEKGIITLVKKKPHHSEWSFPDANLTTDEEDWIDSDLGENDDER